MELFREVQQDSPSVLIGKNLITEGMIKQIKDLVKKNTIIKCKILKSALSMADKEDIVAEVLAKTKYKLVDLRGNTFMLSKRPVKGLKLSKRCRKIINQSGNLNGR